MHTHRALQLTMQQRLAELHKQSLDDATAKLGDAQSQVEQLQRQLASAQQASSRAVADALATATADWQQRLHAAEQRVASLEASLADAQEAVELANSNVTGAHVLAALSRDAPLATGAATAALEVLRKASEHAQANGEVELSATALYARVQLAEAQCDAEKAENAELPGRIYREALKDKGSEVVAFKQLARRYYEWARKKDAGRDALRDIERAFDRNFEMTGDYFALGAYRDILGLVTDLYKQEGLEVEVRRLERKAAKVDDLREDIGKRSKRAERG
ncbi:hypothetical protein EON62_04390 [archaeon]|nr:MAG: hypothetical protein EON62_04390 [archaeon]